MTNSTCWVTNESGVPTDIHGTIGTCIHSSTTSSDWVINESAVSTDDHIGPWINCSIPCSVFEFCIDSSTICSWVTNKRGVPTDVYSAINSKDSSSSNFSCVTNESSVTTIDPWIDHWISLNVYRGIKFYTNSSTICSWVTNKYGVSAEAYIAINCKDSSSLPLSWVT